MAKFNAKSTGTKTVNRAGGEAYAETPKLELVSLLLTSFVKKQHYRSEDETITRLAELIDKISDKRFSAKAAIYARNEFGMRSISHAVAAELAARVKGESWTAPFYDKVVRRPDDITEILSYYMGKNGKPVPNSLKKGLGRALGKFDAYQLGKYRGEGSALSLVDAVNLIHPVPTDKNRDALAKLVAGTLRSTDTWESKITEAGKSQNVEEAKAEAWRDLLVERKIGYFALLRNLRNILEQAPELVPVACELLVDEKLIEKSLVLPFRYLTALAELRQLSNSGVRQLMVAVSEAVDIALRNVPKFDGKTLIVLDESGSMTGGYGYNSRPNPDAPAVIGSVFAAVLAKANPDADLMTFSNDARYQNINPLDTTLTIAGSIQFSSGGTNFQSIFDAANKPYDRIIVLSDMQGWVGYRAPNMRDYTARTGATPRIFSFDLQGYGDLQFPESNVYAIAGFSDKVFDLMKLLETDRNAMVNAIEKVEL